MDRGCIGTSVTPDKRGTHAGMNSVNIKERGLKQVKGENKY